MTTALGQRIAPRPVFCVTGHERRDMRVAEEVAAGRFTFAGTTLAVPGGVTRLLVTGLAPDTGYQTTRDGDRISVSTGGPTTSDHGGVLVVTV